MYENPVTPGRTTVLIVCIGNDLVADDAIGFHIYNDLRSKELPQEVKLLFLAVGGITLLDYLDGTEKAIIVIDSIRFGHEPGTVVRSRWEDLPMPNCSPVSAHGIGLREVFEIIPLLYPGAFTDTIYFIGVEGADFNTCGAALSAPVEGAISDVTNIVFEMLGLLQEEIT